MTETDIVKRETKQEQHEKKKKAHKRKKIGRRNRKEIKGSETNTRFEDLSPPAL